MGEVGKLAANAIFAVVNSFESSLSRVFSLVAQANKPVTSRFSFTRAFIVIYILLILIY